MKKASDFSPIDRVLFQGIRGEVIINKEERVKYLGQLKENVIQSLTFNDMAGKDLDQRFIKAVQEPDLKSIIISGKIAHRDWAQKYSEYAKEHAIPLRVITDSEHVGKIGLVVIRN